MRPPSSLPSYSADLELASSVVETLAAVERRLDDVVRDLSWRVSRLHATWTGESSASHVRAHARWEAGYAEMHAALVVMRAAVRAARDNYQSAGSTNASLWDSVR